MLRFWLKLALTNHPKVWFHNYNLWLPPLMFGCNDSTRSHTTMHQFKVHKTKSSLELHLKWRVTSWAFPFQPIYIPKKHNNHNPTLVPGVLLPSWVEWGTFAAFESACEAETLWSAGPDDKLKSSWLWKMAATIIEISQLGSTLQPANFRQSKHRKSTDS